VISVRLPIPLQVGILLIGMLALAAGPAKALPIRKSHATMVLDAVDKFLVPRLETLTDVTGDLATAVDAVCREGNDASREAARAAFAKTVQAWGGLDFVRFGPSALEHRLERIFFWPDPRGFASRQLNQLLAARKPELLAPGALASQSVAVQGLTALEILLFDDKAPLGAGKDDAARYRCAMAGAIAANIHGVAGEILAGWTGADDFRTKMLTPGSDNALYKDAGETVREVMKALVAGIELCRDRFILPELTAVTANPPRRVRLAFEASGLTGSYLKSSLVALKELYASIGLDAYVPADKPWMTSFLPTSWNSLLADVDRLDHMRANERGSEAHLHALRKMRFDLSGIRQIIVKELAPNADIVMGFNELDGD
jgi:predicted lipoprotein